MCYLWATCFLQCCGVETHFARSLFFRRFSSRALPPSPSPRRVSTPVSLDSEEQQREPHGRRYRPCIDAAISPLPPFAHVGSCTGCISDCRFFACHFFAVFCPLSHVHMSVFPLVCAFPIQLLVPLVFASARGSVAGSRPSVSAAHWHCSPSKTCNSLQPPKTRMRP